MTTPLRYTASLAYAEPMLIKSSEDPTEIAELNRHTTELLVSSEKTYAHQNTPSLALRKTMGSVGAVVMLMGAGFFAHYYFGDEKKIPCTRERRKIGQCPNNKNLLIESASAFFIGAALLYWSARNPDIDHIEKRRSPSYHRLLVGRKERLQELIRELCSTPNRSSAYSTEITRLGRLDHLMQNEINDTAYWIGGGRGENPGFERPDSSTPDALGPVIGLMLGQYKLNWAMRFVPDSPAQGSDSPN